jgi:hypothetical protein
MATEAATESLHTDLQEQLERLRDEHSRLAFAKRMKDPKFAAFCRRKSTAPLKSLQQRLDEARKARAAEIRAYCRPRGPLSILKDNEYTTGRVIAVRRELDTTPFTYVETAKIRRISKDVWESEVTHDYRPEEITSHPQNVPAFGQDLIEDEQTALRRLLCLLAENNALLGKLCGKT